MRLRGREGPVSESVREPRSGGLRGPDRARGTSGGAALSVAPPVIYALLCNGVGLGNARIVVVVPPGYPLDVALYRKYRPASFAEVVGQEHVTEPLSVALSAGRINHAYLFSGPRGCGKTSSARILARSLNCIHGPTATPCGECDSCVALAPGGTGTLDVTELDAASHGGVDDTRDLRERAFFAPASSRYRVLIIDEAHMVTNAGFNALLKIVEEPPEHLIFIFATTEPDKVLPTIRSRTHHYPFRLLTPSSMRGLVERISEQEGVHVDPTVFPLVIRAGGGSPRDTLSVLDQLMAGAGEGGITYPRAVALLGATEVALIDDTVDALASSDGATLFRTVDKVVEAGHDPRRFAADLLQRLRDLIMVQSVPQAIERGLVDAPVEQAETMERQAQQIGPATLARCADMVHEGMASMRGATSPRLLLEILCAKLLLPSADDSMAALLQRVESLESGGVRAAAPTAVPVAAGGGVSPRGGADHDDDDNARPAPAGGPAQHAPGPAEERPKFVRRSQRQSADPAAPSEHAAPDESSEQPAPDQPAVAADPAAPAVPGESVAEQQAVAQQSEQDAAPAPAAPDAAPAPEAATPPAEQPAASAATPPDPAPTQSEDPWGEQAASEQRTAEQPAATDASAPAPAVEQAASESEAELRGEPTPDGATGDIQAEDIRRAWPAIRDAVRTRTRTVEVMLAGATVAGVHGRVIHLVHDYSPLAKRLSQPHNATAITDSIAEVVGGDWTIRCTSGNEASAAAPAAGAVPASAPARGEGAGPTDAPRQAEAQGWERRVRDAEGSRGQSGGRTGGEGTGGGYDDVPPPPEEPEPEPGEVGGPPPAPVSEEEMVDEARGGPQNLDHRTGEDIALALLKEHLGARPLER